MRHRRPPSFVLAAMILICVEPIRRNMPSMPSLRVLRLQVLNWSVLAPEYTAFDGLDALEPTKALAVPSSTSLAACREQEPLPDQASHDYHYFLSGAACVRTQASLFFSFFFVPPLLLVSCRAAASTDTGCCVPIAGVLIWVVPRAKR